MDPNYWYCLVIFERDLDEPSAKFVGRLKRELNGDALYEDQNGNVYYSYLDRRSDPNDDVIQINTESLHYDRSLEQLIASMTDWLNWLQFEEGLPPILRDFDRESIHDQVEYDS
jgi:hypothetical protein